uniref:RNA polymerase subunit H/Rpb5 C-terminal domain-containing protein n=1 Tax=viral metagenome TaxID=1070528 RepID=A0A6C0ASU7_9ZZZZ
MSNSIDRITFLYNARKTLMNQLDLLSYDTTPYAEFDSNEIDAMYAKNQLDMLLTHKTNEKKIYIKFYLSAKQIRPANLDDIIEDLYSIDNVLTKDDTLIIITDDEPNDTIISKLKYLFDHDGIFVIIHNIRRLQYNILERNDVPEHIILNDQEIEEMKKTYNITHLMQLPEISRFDPCALVICMRPGQVCLIKRSSATAMFYNYYRICV